MLPSTFIGRFKSYFLTKNKHGNLTTLTGILLIYRTLLDTKEQHTISLVKESWISHVQNKKFSLIVVITSESLKISLFESFLKVVVEYLMNRSVSS